MKLQYLLLVLLFWSCDPSPKSEVPTETTAYVQTAPEWSKNATIYEVNTRQMTPEGTFAAAELHLERLQKMGVDILWLMPIHPIGVLNRKGGLGSYYAVRDYKAVNPEHGTDADFKSFVDHAHQLGMKVILDWVANHTAPDNVWVDQGHKDWYNLDEDGNLQPPGDTDWWDVADLNYDNLEMRKEMIACMKYWVEEFDIDGYRCDVADWVPVDFWNDTRKALDEVKPVFMLAEAENPEHHVSAFDMSYAWDFHHRMNQIAKGEMDVDDIRSYLKDRSRFPADAYRMHFTSNHDENSWNGTVKERMGDARMALAVLSATMEGMPLVYTGQEAPLDKRLEFFEKDTVDWGTFALEDFYSKLLHLNKDNPALWNGIHGGDLMVVSPDSLSDVFAFTRQKDDSKVFCLFNFSGEPKAVPYSGLTGGYDELFTDEHFHPEKEGMMEIEAWGYRVYVNE